jgi:hypothetical protein
MNFSEKMMIDGIDVEYDFDGVYAHVKMVPGEIVSMDAHINYLHKLGREHYDTPASIASCGCKSCNASRRQHRKRCHGWDKKTIQEFGTVARFGMSQNDMNRKIESTCRGW